MAQEYLAPVLHAGSLAVDATAGNGHDTAFLARHTLPGGQVAAFDVQPEALEATRAALTAAGLVGRVWLIHDGHQHMDRYLASWQGRVDAVMFNLGYLPGADHGLTTRTETTLAALQEAARLLHPDGRMTIMSYPGHPAGADEDAAIRRWLASPACPLIAERLTMPLTQRPSPCLYLARNAGR